MGWGQPCSATCLQGVGQRLQVPASLPPGNLPEILRNPLFATKPLTWLFFSSQSA